MPVIESLNGIKISIYYNDHVPPHIHARYAEFEALVDIRKVEVFRGELPSSKIKLVLKYVKENADELLNLFYELNPTIERI